MGDESISDREKPEKLRGIKRVGNIRMQNFGDWMRELPKCVDCGREDCEIWAAFRKSKPVQT